MKNLSTLFYDTGDRPCLLNEITLTKRKRIQLLTASHDIRQRLEKYLPDLLNQLVEENGVEDQEAFPKPRFLVQGSFASKTVNAPCRPPQQADLDDGLYLPYSTVKETPPEAMSEILFNAVAKVLRDMATLAQYQTWTLNTDNGNCVRMEIGEDMHIDIPIYSIPDHQFHQLENSQDAARTRTLEKSESSSVAFTAEAFFDAVNSERSIPDSWLNFAEELLEASWESMPTEKVLMASRDGGWKAKDPRPILEWFAAQVNAKGVQLNRVVRYVKAWRDYQEWSRDDPKSILLMVAVSKCFPHNVNRDDHALLTVLKSLPSTLSGSLINPSIPEEEEDLAARLDEKNIRNDVVQRITNFSLDLERAMANTGSPEESIRLVKKHLGDRFPEHPRKIAQATVAAAAAIVSPVQASSPQGSVVHA